MSFLSLVAARASSALLRPCLIAQLSAAARCSTPRRMSIAPAQRHDGRSLLEGTSTHDNLKQAFAEESMACMRYLYFAKIAEDEGFADVALAFRSIAESERSHCFRWLEQLQQVADPLTSEPIGDTFSNLKAAVSSEKHDSQDMYPKMAATAKAEGFPELAQAFIDTSMAEGRHAKKLHESSKQLVEFLGRPREF